MNIAIALVLILLAAEPSIQVKRFIAVQCDQIWRN